MWKMRIVEHLLQDDQEISFDFSPILAAHKIFEKKKTWVSSQRRTHEKNHANKRTPLCQVLIFQLLWWLLVCAQLDILMASASNDQGVSEVFPNRRRSGEQHLEILALPTTTESAQSPMKCPLPIYIRRPLWALALFFEPICRYSSLYCRSHFSGQNIIQNNILVYYSFEFAILNAKGTCQKTL